MVLLKINSIFSFMDFYIEKILKMSLYLLFLATAVLIVVQVLLRYVFCAPLMGTEEILVFPTIWLYFLGAVNASRDESHITAKVLEVFIKKKSSLYLERTIMSILSLAVVLWLTYWAWDYFLYSFKAWKLSASLYIPMFFAESAFLVGLVLMSVYTFVELLKNIKLFRFNREEEAVSSC